MSFLGDESIMEWSPCHKENRETNDGLNLRLINNSLNSFSFHSPPNKENVIRPMEVDYHSPSHTQQGIRNPEPITLWSQSPINNESAIKHVEKADYDQRSVLSGLTNIGGTLKMCPSDYSIVGTLDDSSVKSLNADERYNDNKSIFSRQSTYSDTTNLINQVEREDTETAISSKLNSDCSQETNIRSLRIIASKKSEETTKKKSSIFLFMLFVIIPTIFGYFLIKLQTISLLKSNMDISLFNISRDLRENVVGQDDSIRSILNQMEMYKIKKKKEPLVLLFHGPSGTGKTHTSQLISRSFPSNNVHLYVTSYHFGSKAKLLDLSAIRDIPDLIKEWSKNLIIFDGLESADPQVLEALFSTLHVMKRQSTRINYTVFILIDTSKTENFDKFERSKKFQRVISAVLNEKTWFEEFISSSLIDEFVPFQALEKKHTIQCLILEAKTRGLKLSPEKLDAVLDIVPFEEINGIEYSKSGCTAISNKIDILE